MIRIPWPEQQEVKNDPEHCRRFPNATLRDSLPLEQVFGSSFFQWTNEYWKIEWPVKLAESGESSLLQVETPSLGMMIKRKRKKEHHATHIMPGRPGKDVSWLPPWWCVPSLITGLSLENRDMCVWVIRVGESTAHTPYLAHHVTSNSKPQHVGYEWM